MLSELVFSPQIGIGIYSQSQILNKYILVTTLAYPANTIIVSVYLLCYAPYRCHYNAILYNRVNILTQVLSVLRCCV